MKRQVLLSRIAEAARKNGATWQWEREGGNHTIYTLNGTTIPIPRHREIGERLANNIFGECEETFGKGWWKK